MDSLFNRDSLETGRSFSTRPFSRRGDDKNGVQIQSLFETTSCGERSAIMVIPLLRFLEWFQKCLLHKLQKTKTGSSFDKRWFSGSSFSFNDFVASQSKKFPGTMGWFACVGETRCKPWRRDGWWTFFPGRIDGPGEIPSIIFNGKHLHYGVPTFLDPQVINM